MTLVRSISGVRGIVGETLSPALAARHAQAFAGLQGGRIAIGRDSRPSGPELLRWIVAGTRAGGADAVDLDLCATPAVQVAVEELRAGGGIVLTASHNPAPWNGLKFIGADGTFLGPRAVAALFAAADALAEAATPAADDPPAAREDAIGPHVGRALAAPEMHLDRLAGAGLRVVVDGCRSVGGLSTLRALTEAGCEAIALDCEPDGRFTRGLEPVPEHLAALGERVRAEGADFGVAHDPDGDRAALVDETGTPLGEEWTLAIAIDAVLAEHPGPVVVNLSTSRVSEDVATARGVPFERAPVGEIHVVERMREIGAVIGGEGNGGVILPSAHLGRDGTVAALLAARWRAERGRPLSAARAAFPVWRMRKEKFEGVVWATARGAVLERFRGAALDERDGLRFAWPDAWLHVRPSGTEPIVRLIAEARDAERLDALCAAARDALGRGERAGAARGGASGR